MKRLVYAFRFHLRGYGGMLLIAFISLSILVFGGIVTNIRTIHQLRDDNETLEQTINQRVASLPIAAQIEALEAKLGSFSIGAPSTARKTLSTSAIPQLGSSISDMATAAGLRLARSDYSLDIENTASPSLRADLRFDGSYAALRTLLLSLMDWEYTLVVEGFSIWSTGRRHEMNLVIWIPLT